MAPGGEGEGQPDDGHDITVRANARTSLALEPAGDQSGAEQGGTGGLAVCWDPPCLTPVSALPQPCLSHPTARTCDVHQRAAQAMESCDAGSRERPGADRCTGTEKLMGPTHKHMQTATLSLSPVSEHHVSEPPVSEASISENHVSEPPVSVTHVFEQPALSTIPPFGASVPFGREGCGRGSDTPGCSPTVSPPGLYFRKLLIYFHSWLFPRFLQFETPVSALTSVGPTRASPSGYRPG